MGARGSDEFQLGQSLEHSVILARCVVRMEARRSSLGRQLIERDLFGLDKSHIAHIDYGNVCTFAGILKWKRAYDEVASVGRDQMRFDRTADNMLRLFSITESNNELKKRLA